MSDDVSMGSFVCAFVFHPCDGCLSSRLSCRGCIHVLSRALDCLVLARTSVDLWLGS